MEDVDQTNWYSNEAATFGDRVAAARSDRGMDQKALARHLGVAVKTVDGWENDVSEPRANKLQMLAGVLDVSIPWLLTGEGQSFETVDPGSAELSELLVELRTLRAEMLNNASRLGVLEKRLSKIA